MANPQTSDVTNPHLIVQVNSKWCNGIAPGYAPTAGTGLILNLGSGTAFSGSTRIDYAGGTVTLLNSTTNYVFLDSTVGYAPNSNTTGYPPSSIPICSVVTAGGVITVIVDDRSSFRGGSNNYAGDVAITSTTRGDFTVAHGLGTTPTVAFVQMTSNGLIRFQATRYDATNLYLNASADGLLGHVSLFI